MKKNIIDFICSLHGYLIRIKEIHWNTESNSIHLLCDEISDDLSDCEDRFTECAMGMSGEHFKIGDLKPMLPHATSLIPMLKELEKEIIEMEDSLTSKKDNGLINILDEMLENCNKYKYRATQK
jgi:DNA-binding ferritin-like protein